ncbi:MAG: glycerol-3-phosphate acyltransferase [Alicyclobacillus mali]|uniref:glycerol-3-phosphate acyltransferase n=1 Tax=Alicyclobacillus mali (ex Roth et al. 2021) TaxID=1123961 RepID=UPI0023F31682|nr:glycerol-3-phosphate acyltransferase [Alicyclobacillus mali (ex Roth et al. 2021)]MCL6488863.1 glycerol-3-phosphate acyltransferase [Alicyclobacillus mali (ex Roth et al. 2021)]
MNAWMGWTLGLAAAFIVGACPFAVWLTRAMGRDPRSFGDGNPGAANAFRAAGFWLGAAVLVLDVAKGFVPGYFALRHISANWPLAALAAALPVYGHRFSPFLRGRGGIGLASWIGSVAGFLGPLAAGLLGCGFACGLAIRRRDRARTVAFGAAVLLMGITVLPEVLWPVWRVHSLWSARLFWLLTAPLVWWGYRVRNVRREEV